MSPEVAGPESGEEFYDRLAAEYHLVFADWRKSVRRQGQVLGSLIRGEAGSGALSVLDCTCGIGTQAIGLALQGFQVHGSDISPASIERATREAASFDVKIYFSVADLRHLDTQVARTFDVVVSCDNALPHLLTDDDLKAAIGSIRSKLKPGGILLASIRDYDEALEERPKATRLSVFDDAGGRRIVFQVWDWLDDGRNYIFHLFILRMNSGVWTVSEHIGQYRALRRQELSNLLSAAGMSGIRWIMPEESGYHQPVVICQR